jgi:hypothetical protein
MQINLPEVTVQCAKCYDRQEYTVCVCTIEADHVPKGCGDLVRREGSLEE